MDARGRWQALQARLTAARAAADAGDRTTALSEVTAALELDGEFLAAHALRDRILAMAEAPSHPVPPRVATSQPAPSHPAPAGAPACYAKFEQRAKRRRVDRRIDAARAAIEQQRLTAAATALDEVIELDPNLPELAELTARFDELRRAAATPHRGPWIAAAAVFVVALFSGSWVQDSTPLLSRHVLWAAPLPPPMTPSVTVTERFETIGTAGERARVAAPSSAADAAGPIQESAFAASTLPSVDETMLVTQTLLGYRWNTDAADVPVGFDSCEPRVENAEATAVCHAAAVAWTVKLRKTADTWRIETARAER